MIGMAGAEEVKRNIGLWMERQIASLQALGEHFGAKMEGEAKVEGPWTDRTGAARKGLFGEARTDEGFLRVRIAHSVQYGVSLELNFQGRYSVLQPVAKRNAPQFFQAVKELMDK